VLGYEECLGLFFVARVIIPVGVLIADSLRTASALCGVALHPSSTPGTDQEAPKGVARVLEPVGAWPRRGRSNGGRYDRGTANRPNDLPPGSAVVVTNPDEDCSPPALHAFLDDLLAGPEPELESLDAAEAATAVARRC